MLIVYLKKPLEHQTWLPGSWERLIKECCLPNGQGTNVKRAKPFITVNNLSPYKSSYFVWERELYNKKVSSENRLEVNCFVQNKAVCLNLDNHNLNNFVLSSWSRENFTDPDASERWIPRGWGELIASQSGGFEICHPTFVFHSLFFLTSEQFGHPCLEWWQPSLLKELKPTKNVQLCTTY